MTRTLAVILLLSALLAGLYAWATPIGGAPDEHAHAEYVRIVAEEGRLPQLDVSRPRNRNTDKIYEAHQPPLYYAGAALAWHAFRTFGPDAAPWGARCFSVLAGLWGIYLIWRIARELCPGRPAIWHLAAAIAAFLPMRLHVTASVSNDSLAEATTSLALLCMIRALRGTWDTRRAALLGAAVGAALLAKLSAVMLLPAVLVTVYGASFKAPIAAPAEPPRGSRRKRRKTGATSAGDPSGTTPGPAAATRLFVRSGALVLGVVLLLAGWCFLRNQLLYGDPLGKQAFDWYFADTTRFEDWRRGGYTFAAYLQRKVFPTTFATFWGAFGHLDPSRPDLFMGAYGPGPPSAAWDYPPRSWIYPWLMAATLLGAAGFLLQSLTGAARRRRESQGNAGGLLTGEPASGALLGIHALFVTASFLNFNATYFQAQGRYLFPALAAWSLVLSQGWLAGCLPWREARRARCETGVALFCSAGMLLLAVYAGWFVVRPGFGLHP